MRSEMEALAEQMVTLGRGYDPATVSGDDAEAIGDLARVIGRAAGSIEARSDARAAEANAWRRAGARSPEEWLAGKSGTSKAKARKKLKLGEQLDRHDNLRDRYTIGDVSNDQAEVIGGAVDENPNAEQDLLDAAEDESLAGLKKKAAQAKAAVSDEEARQAKIHEERYGSAGSDEEGAYRGSFRMSAFQGGIFDTHWQRFRDQVAADAKKQSLRLNAGQIAADALVLRLTRRPRPPRRHHAHPRRRHRPRTRLRSQGRDLRDRRGRPRGRRGATAECEHSAGLAEVRCSRIRWSMAQGLLAGLREQLTSSPERVASRARPNAHTSSPGRAHIPAVLDTAIRIRDRVCAHSGCDHRHRLQRDHRVAVGLGGRTTYHQLQRLCWNHHESKTREDIRKIRAKKQAERAGPAP